MLWPLQSCSLHWDTRYWCIGFARKVFLSTISLIINVHPESNLDNRKNPYSFCYGHYNHVLRIEIHVVDDIGFVGKAFLSTIILIINVHPRNESNMDIHNNLHSFCYGHYNHVLHIGIHDIDALDSLERLFFPPFHL